jgi:hypothetical protein
MANELNELFDKIDEDEEDENGAIVNDSLFRDDLLFKPLASKFSSLESKSLLIIVELAEI